MLKGIAGKIALTLTLISLAPLALEAQESATVRVSARVVSSVIPETQATAATQIANVAETVFSEPAIVKQTGQTERGYAQITTESMEISADGFLRQMVRIIAGTLIEVGLGKRDPEDMKRIIAAGDRRAAGPTAPACGLTLLRVQYRGGLR